MISQRGLMLLLLGTLSAFIAVCAAYGFYDLFLKGL